MAKTKVSVCCCFLLLLLSLLAVIIPPFVIYSYAVDPWVQWKDVNSIDQVSYNISKNTQSLCVNASCVGTTECEYSFTSFLYKKPPEKQFKSYYDEYHNSALKVGYYVYDCRTVSSRGSVTYSYSLSSARKMYIFSYAGFLEFRTTKDTSSGTLIAEKSSGTYSWVNYNLTRSETRCFVVDNRKGASSISINLYEIIENYWYKTSNVTAERYCVGPLCCFNNTESGYYIIVDHDYKGSSPNDDATVSVGALVTVRFGTVVIVHMVLGSIAFCFFFFFSVLPVCAAFCDCISSSSSSSTKYPSVGMKTVQSVPTVRTSASDYSAAKAHAPSSVSSITMHVTVTEAVSRIRPDNVEVDLSEFSKFIPAVDTEECRKVRILCDMAESGDAEAIYLFGICFKEAIAVQRDYTRAALLFLIAAKKGNDDAVCELGVAYENGNGVDQDYSKAVILYQAAALEGCTDAMVRLGLCYLNGTGIEEDHIKAIQLWIIAAAAGNEMAKAIIEKIQNL